MKVKKQKMCCGLLSLSVRVYRVMVQHVLKLQGDITFSSLLAARAGTIKQCEDSYTLTENHTHILLLQ